MGDHILGTLIMITALSSGLIIGSYLCDLRIELELKKPVEVHEIAPCAEGYND